MGHGNGFPILLRPGDFVIRWLCLNFVVAAIIMQA